MCFSVLIGYREHVIYVIYYGTTKRVLKASIQTPRTLKELATHAVSILIWNNVVVKDFERLLNIVQSMLSPI